MGLFQRDPIKKLSKQYQKLMEKAHKVSHSDRAEGDRLMAEAEEIAKKIDSLKK